MHAVPIGKLLHRSDCPRYTMSGGDKQQRGTWRDVPGSSVLDMSCRNLHTEYRVSDLHKLFAGHIRK